MLNTVEAIAKRLEGTFLDGQPIRQLKIDASEQWAFLMEVDRAIALDAWGVMRSLLPETQRYPIITESWGSDDFFSRFYYQEEYQAGLIAGVSPEEIISRVPEADIDTFLETRKAASADALEDEVEYTLELTAELFGSSPTSAEIEQFIDQEIIRSHYDLEKWLFNWEWQHFGIERAIAATDTRYLNWFEPDRPTASLLLLPTAESWNTLAYLHWFGACTAGTATVIRFLQQWHQHYGAEIVCHYGTMLQFNVATRPQTLEASFELAWQQEALAECTTILPGVPLREHARSLLVLDRWFLHERP
jgi:hypothetical protein